MYQPSRRAVLCGVGSLVGTAGCLGRDGSPTDGSVSPSTGSDRPSSDVSTPTTTPTAPSTPPTTPTVAPLGAEQSVDGVPITVSDLAVRDAVLYLDTPDSMALATREGERYALVSVSGGESGPPPETLSLVVDGERFRGRVDPFGGPTSLSDRGPPYDPADGTSEGWVSFVVPTALDATDARVVAETERGSAAWRLDDAHVSALRRPKPRFELREVDIPERVTVGERVSVRVAAANVSGVAGVFRGVLNVANLQYAYAPYPFALDAAPGETVAWERTFDRTPPERADSIGFFLDTVAGNRETRAPVQHGTRGDTATAGTTTAASDASG